MDFNKYFDHTVLKPEATRKDVEKICEEAINYQFASVCVNSSYTQLVAHLLKGTEIDVCTVIGFPLGAMSTNSKKYEAMEAIIDGASEIDMVIHVGALKDENYEYVLNDIKEVHKVCIDNSVGRRAILKVIIESCLLTDGEIIKACELSVEAGAEFVKTSTGFSSGGATTHSVKLMKDTVGNRAKVKASGGIRDLETAKAMIEAGADRLGTSATTYIYDAYM